MDNLFDQSGYFQIATTNTISFSIVFSFTKVSSTGLKNPVQKQFLQQQQQLDRAFGELQNVNVIEDDKIVHLGADTQVAVSL